MSDFTIADTNVPQYDPWTPMQKMAQISGQNLQNQGMQIQQQGQMLNLDLQRARLAPVLSALQSYQAQTSPGAAPLGGGNPSMLPGMSGGPSGGVGPNAVSTAPLAPPSGVPGSAGAQQGASALATMAAPPPAGSGSSSGDGVPSGPGDLAYSQLGVPMPILQYAAIAGSSDPSAAAAKIVDTRRQLLYTGAEQANSPQSWNSFIMQEYKNGWIASDQANQLFNHFEMQPRVLQALASPDANLGFTSSTSGQGLTTDANGNLVPGAAQVAAKGLVAGAESNAKNASDLNYKPAIAGATAAATEAAQAPYTAPITLHQRDAQGNDVTVQVPVGSWAAQNGAGGAAPGGAPAASPVAGAPNPNNPGNMRVPGATGPNGFQNYDNPISGLFAVSDQLQKYGQRGINTLAGIVGTYAPPSENNTQAYLASVVKATGLNPNQPLNMNDPNVRGRVAQAMLQMEGNTSAIRQFMGPASTPVGVGPSAGAPAAGVPPAAASQAVPPGIVPGSAAEAGVPIAPGAPGPVAAPVPGVVVPPVAQQPPLPLGGGSLVPPPPTGGPAAIPGAIVGGTTLNPVNQAQVTNNIDQMGDYRKGLVSGAQAAVQQNAMLDQMGQEAGGFAQGTFANMKGQAKAYLDGVAQTLGIPESAQFTAGLGDWQAFNKNAGNLARAAAHELGSKTGVQELSMIQSVLPTAQTSAQGFQYVKDQLQGMNDFVAAKAAASANFQGNPAQFEGAWNSSVSPTAFIINRMSSPDFQALAQRLSQTPDGLATLKKMRGEYQYAQSNGLFGAVAGQ